MEFSTKFSDFDSKDLVGKYVLYESGMTYNTQLSQYIKTITKVTKTGFRISGEEKLLFSFSGEQKGLTSRWNMGQISRCSLLTDDEMIQLKNGWSEKIKLNQYKNQVLEKLNKGTQTSEQLEQILKILTN